MKRSRYTIHFHDGDKSVYLLYAGQEQAVKDHYAALGKPVTRIVKGDYRKAVTTTGGYVIDPSALRDAIDLLDLKIPVKVRHHARQGATNGNYRLRKDRGQLWHDIMVKSYLSVEQASHTLWHELTHAMQAERVMKAGQTWQSHTAAQARWTYSRRPIEIEARQMSDDMRDCLLTRPR